jgi:hypothetical protein
MKIIGNLLEKFPFTIVDQSVPVETIVENGRLTGLVFQKTHVQNNKLIQIPDSDFRIKTPLVISAIGSIPEPVAGLEMRGNTYDIKDPHTGELKGYDNVFALGNAVTGRGNIKDSQMHGRRVADYVHDQYLAWKEEDYQEIFRETEKNADRKLIGIESKLGQKSMPEERVLANIIHRVIKFQEDIGYTGNYRAWLDQHRPVRLEDMPV